MAITRKQIEARLREYSLGRDHSEVCLDRAERELSTVATTYWKDRATTAEKRVHELEERMAGMLEALRALGLESPPPGASTATHDDRHANGGAPKLELVR